MKSTVYHKQDPEYRVVVRGQKWYTQKLSGIKGTKTEDPWFDFGPAKDSQAEAVAAMYVSKPLKVMA